MSPLQEAFKQPISTKREYKAVLVILQIAKCITLMFRDDFTITYYNNIKIILLQCNDIVCLFVLLVTTPAKQICKKLPHVKYATYKKHDNLR